MLTFPIHLAIRALGFFGVDCSLESLYNGRRGGYHTETMGVFQLTNVRVSLHDQVGILLLLANAKGHPNMFIENVWIIGEP